MALRSARATLFALLLLAAAPLRAQILAPADTVPLPSDTAAALLPELPARMDGTVRICSGGDVTLGTNLGPGWAKRAAAGLLPHPDSLLAPLRPLLADADLLLLNVEGAIGEGPLTYRKCGPQSTQCFAFRQPVAAAGALRRLAAGAEVVGNVANNHAGDAGADGLRETVSQLAAAGVHVAGADTLATAVALRWGDTVAVLGFSTSGDGPDPRDTLAVRRHVGRAAERYSRVVVTVHMGAEGAGAQRTRDSTEWFLGSIDRGNPVAFARAATGAGADLVAGHGPHVMRALEWRGDALVLYSLGNLVTYGPFSNRAPLDRGAIVCTLLDRDGRVTAAEVRSTRQRAAGRVAPDPLGRAAVLADSLGRLDFPQSGARIRPGGELVLPGDTVPVPGSAPRQLPGSSRSSARRR